jgi:hypothetical protein
LHKNRMAVPLLTFVVPCSIHQCFQGFGDSSMDLKSISSHAQYVTLQKYFSHPSLVFFSPTPRIKLKTGTWHRWETTSTKSPGPIKLSSQSIAGVTLCCAYWHQHPVQKAQPNLHVFHKVSGSSGLGNII